MSDCRFCGNSQVNCLAASPTEVFVCTRPVGHDGDHVACGNDTHEYDQWQRGVSLEDAIAGLRSIRDDLEAS